MQTNLLPVCCSPCFSMHYTEINLLDLKARIEVLSTKVFGTICMFVFQISVGSKDMP